MKSLLRQREEGKGREERDREEGARREGHSSLKMP